MRRRHRSCVLLILLTECFVRNIHTKGFNKKESISFYWSVVMYFWNLVRALYLMLAFLLTFDRCFAKLSLLSIVTPSTFSYLLFLDSCLDVVLWTKFGNSSIYMREVVITSVLKGFDQKNHFFLRGDLGSSSIIWDWH